MEKKIMFCNMTMSAGGAERVIANLANNFAHKKYNVRIATFLPRDIAYSLDKKIQVYKPKMKRKSIFNLIRNSVEVIKYINKEKPNFVLAFCPTACFLLCFYRIFNKRLKIAKLIISERNNPQSEYKNCIVKFIANFLYKFADVVVFQTNDAMSFFNKKVISKGVIIPNPINQKFIDVVIEKDCVKEKSIVSVGRFHEQKNHKELIVAFSNIIKKFPQYTLKLYGEGELENDLKELVKELNLEKKVKFLGVSNCLEKELPKNEIFVLNSYYEGMPNALMEAMALGLACISTNCPCGGPRELIQDSENGFLVPVGDVKILEKKIVELIINPELRNKFCLNAKKIIKKYNPDAIYTCWENLIK